MWRWVVERKGGGYTRSWRLINKEGVIEEERGGQKEEEGRMGRMFGPS